MAAGSRQPQRLRSVRQLVGRLVLQLQLEPDVAPPASSRVASGVAQTPAGVVVVGGEVDKGSGRTTGTG